jgi:hypothetical protein
MLVSIGNLAIRCWLETKKNQALHDIGSEKNEKKKSDKKFKVFHRVKKVENPSKNPGFELEKEFKII